jgi:hypothetical protein
MIAWFPGLCPAASWFSLSGRHRGTGAARKERQPKDQYKITCHTPNDTKMSDGGPVRNRFAVAMRAWRGRASLVMEMEKSFQKVEHTAVRRSLR